MRERVCAWSEVQNCAARMYAQCTQACAVGAQLDPLLPLTALPDNACTRRGLARSQATTTRTRAMLRAT